MDRLVPGARYADYLYFRSVVAGWLMTLDIVLLSYVLILLS